MYFGRVGSSLKLLKPIAVAFARIEGDNAIQSDVQTACRCKRRNTYCPAHLTVAPSRGYCSSESTYRPQRTCWTPSMLARASCLVQRSTRPMVSSLLCLATLGWMRARFLSVWRSTLPSKGFGMEMQYGSRANISHQPPGERDFVDLRLFIYLELYLFLKENHFFCPLK